MTPVRRLDRKDAAKNINYDADAGSFFRSSSLELEDFSVSSSPLKSRDRKIGGGEGEMDLTFKSLGFSGPEDLHISFDAWEAWSTRELDKHKVLREAGPGGVNITDPDITELMMRSDSSLNKTDLIDRIKQVRSHISLLRCTLILWEIF